MSITCLYLSCLVSSRLVLYCLALSCFVLSCLVLSCHALPLSICRGRFLFVFMEMAVDHAFCTLWLSKAEVAFATSPCASSSDLICRVALASQVATLKAILNTTDAGCFMLPPPPPPPLHSFFNVDMSCTVTVTVTPPTTWQRNPKSKSRMRCKRQ